jgi:dTDP-4-dehydrorhamnose reductase
MKILVTGSQGQLGRACVQLLGDDAIPFAANALDVTDAAAVQTVFQQLKPDAIINCAGFTHVDRAEQDADRCTAVNAAAVVHLARACERIGAVLVQISSDYVFGADQDRREPYVETDPPGPQNVYGHSKLQGERNATICSRHFVVRTCGLYGPSPQHNNFVDKMLQLARQRDQLQVVDDQTCSPTYVVHLARAIRFLLDTSAYGVYHVVNSGATSWYAFAAEVFRLAGVDVRLAPITSAQFGAVAPRPRYSVLATAKYHQLAKCHEQGGPAMPHWTAALREYLTTRKTLPSQ